MSPASDPRRPPEGHPPDWGRSPSGGRPRRLRDGLAGDSGSAAAEFVLVSALLALVVLVVIQLALALYVRTTLIDAAAEGARQQALAGAAPGAGVARTGMLIDSALGPGYPRRISVTSRDWDGRRVVEIDVQSSLPLVGLLGPDRALRVAGHAAVEQVRS